MMDWSSAQKRQRPPSPPGIHSVGGAAQAPVPSAARHIDFDVGQVHSKLDAALQTHDAEQVLACAVESVRVLNDLCKHIVTIVNTHSDNQHSVSYAVGAMEKAVQNLQKVRYALEVY